jgi:Tfp pilus assembly protein PilE/ribosomal protein L40E
MDDMTGKDAKRADADTKFCSDCGATISRRAEICPQCGVRQIAAVAAGSGTGKVVKGCLVAVVVGFVFVVVIGILAAIAIPKFANTKEKAYVAAMKSDLRNLATYEEQYAAHNGGVYFSGTATSAAPLNGFSPMQNETLTATATRDPNAWAATAQHSQTAVRCSFAEGVISCAR